METLQNANKLSSLRLVITNAHLDRVKELKDNLEEEFENYAAFTALGRTDMGLLFLNNLINEGRISPAFLHMAVELAAQDFWDYKPFTESHFKAVDMAQRDISEMIKIALKYQDDVKESKDIQDEALNQISF